MGSIEYRKLDEKLFKMKIVFIGATSFSLKCLKKIVSIPSCEVIGVITSPKKFNISYSINKVKNILHSDLTKYCELKSIDYSLTGDGMKSEDLLKTVKKWNPDIFFVSGWYYMIPQKWMMIAPAYGMHASLLPDYSGGAPLVWAMINGEKKTGITLFKMDKGVDSGPIVGQLSVPINKNDTIASLYKKIELKGIELIDKYLPMVVNGKAKLKIQDEKKRKIYPQRSPKDGEIDWNMPSIKIENFIKAQTKPYPGAFTIINGKKVIIWDADILDIEKNDI